jgi:hypothetical protein
MVFYLQQNVALLDQISNQLLSVAPQVTIPSTPPPPFPSFEPLKSDIRVNVFWFMALIFSLAAALLAILMQQWVRDYMHVFQRYSDPLKCARVRQYLRDGLDDGHMPGVAEAVPGCLHVSLFLFFAGLCDFLLNFNTTVGIYTTVPIAMTGLLYIAATFVPIIRPQSPYQTWFSTIFSIIISFIRHPKQKSDGTRDQDRDSDGVKKLVRSITTQGRMQLAMEETEQRKVRDEEAIQWLIRNMTEDAEMESLVMAIPGSFNCKWGLEVWENVSKSLANDPHTGPMPLLPGSDAQNVRPYSTTAQTEGDNVMHELNTRVARLMETCKNRDLFASEELWRKRTRGCVETVVSLVHFTGTDLSQFGDIVKLLGDIGVSLKVRESSSEGKDQIFVIRWTCLSLLAIQPILAKDQNLRSHASLAMSSLTEDPYHTGGRQILMRIIGTFEKVLECLEELSGALISPKDIKEEEARKNLEDHKTAISTLADIGDQYDDSADTWIQAVQRDLVKITHRIICQLPGTNFDDPDAKFAHLDQLKNLHLTQLEEPHLTQLEKPHLAQLEKFYLSQLMESYLSQLKESYRVPHKFQLITLSHRLKRIRQVAQTFKNLLDGPWNTIAFEEGIEDLKGVLSLLKDAPLHREVWRLQDLCEGRGLGFTIELFLLALKQLLPTSSSKESHSALLEGTFKAITSDSSKGQSPLGTQQLLLDCVVSTNDIVFGSTDTIIGHFFSLLGTVLKGQSGPHIEDIVQRLKGKSTSLLIPDRHREFYARALAVINEANATSASRPPS